MFLVTKSQLTPTVISKRKKRSEFLGEISRKKEEEDRRKGGVWLNKLEEIVGMGIIV